MKRLAALILAAVWLGPTARAADPTFVPTSPQVPLPRLDNGSVLPASGTTGFGDRVLVPLRERVALAIAPSLAAKAGAQAVASGMPLPTGYAPGGCATGECANGGCGGRQSRGCPERFKAWLCFCPTAGDALPKLRPAPYVGPITGTFPCHSGGCCGGNGYPAAGPYPPRAAYGTAGVGMGAGGAGYDSGIGNGGIGLGRGNGVGSGNGCGNTNAGGCAADGKGKAGHGGLGLGLLGHGCKGECVPPPENPLPGYHFALPESPIVTGRPPSPVSTSMSTSYKVSEPPAATIPANTDPLARPLMKQ
jgi:hypothetical protein